jgi:hypothetical protein
MLSTVFIVLVLWMMDEELGCGFVIRWSCFGYQASHVVFLAFIGKVILTFLCFRSHGGGGYWKFENRWRVTVELKRGSLFYDINNNHIIIKIFIYFSYINILFKYNISYVFFVLMKL